MGKTGCDRAPVASADATVAEQSADSGKDGSLRLRVATFLFSHDKILDASSKLAHHFLPSTAHLNEKDAKRLGIQNGDTVLLCAQDITLEATASVNSHCQPGGVVVPRASDWQGVNGLIAADGGPAWVEVRKV